MAVKLRLKRFGKKKKPSYRLVAMDSKNQRDGKSIELLSSSLLGSLRNRS